ncbi:fasciclin domain-containing protein [Paradesertivirga mongoliensis]|uniref:Fasciclin domain-containing protein n=1 Tax=Paradesertivirga mongoliensis TaxID=2100740 RepID=A0ABW4ZJ71_9SPHI|nr:fasciclin domain-containing protein [Pedobacter mongoliensis]
MKRSIQGLLSFLSFVLLFSACQKKDWDEYYGRPADLAPPIYQQLQAKGNFNTLLAVIEKAGYKDILGTAGSWTLFAPTDAAFQKYFQEQGISGPEVLTKDQARKLALYGLVFNPYRKSQLTALQTGGAPLPEYANIAYRRQTAYYDFVYDENGKKVMAAGQPHGTASIPFVYNPKIDNNKYIPYFITSFMDYNGLTPGDYNKLYPGVPFSGFNVADATVLEADIPAENGIIHVVDKVLTPLPNVEQYLASKPEYSEFKALLDKLAFYTESPELTRRYNVLTGSSEPVFLKTYPGMAFAPNNENFLSPGITGQYQSFSVAIPTNQQLKAYTDDLLEYYKTFEAAPPSVLENFINSHLWVGTVWPESIVDQPNFQFQAATFNASNVIENKVLSNANFYGINAVQQADIFRSLYRHAYLNPDYLLMTRAIDGTDARTSLMSVNLKQTVILANDAAFKASGYDWYPDQPAWGYTAPNTTTPNLQAIATTRVNRMVQMHVLLTPNGEFDNVATGEGIAETIHGEYVKYKDGKIFAAGNVADGSFVTVTAKKNSVNGTAYQAAGALKIAEDDFTLGRSIELLGTHSDPNIKNKFSHFWDYLRNTPTSVWDNSIKKIAGVDDGVFHTALIPTNAAIEDAVRAGILPGTPATGVPRFTQASQTEAEKASVVDFIMYSIVAKTTFAVDGKKAGTYPTLLKKGNGESRLVTVSYPSADPTLMNATDDAAASPVTATANYTFSNNLANRALIHSINKVLKFK